VTLAAGQAAAECHRHHHVERPRPLAQVCQKKFRRLRLAAKSGLSAELLVGERIAAAVEARDDSGLRSMFEQNFGQRCCQVR